MHEAEDSVDGSGKQQHRLGLDAIDFGIRKSVQFVHMMMMMTACDTDDMI